jgi:hypothetical protein
MAADRKAAPVSPRRPSRLVGKRLAPASIAARSLAERRQPRIITA